MPPACKMLFFIHSNFLAEGLLGAELYAGRGLMRELLEVERGCELCCWQPSSVLQNSLPSNRELMPREVGIPACGHTVNMQVLTLGRYPKSPLSCSTFLNANIFGVYGIAFSRSIPVLRMGMTTLWQKLCLHFGYNTIKQV